MKKVLLTALLLAPFAIFAQGQPCPCGQPTPTNPVSNSFTIVPGSGNVSTPGGGTTVDCCKGTVVPGSGGIRAIYSPQYVNRKWVYTLVGVVQMSGAAAQNECCGEPI